MLLSKKRYYIGYGETIELPFDSNVFLPSGAGIFFLETLLDKKISQKNAKIKKILDLGCGSGFISIAMGLHGVKYITASDINNHHVEYAKKQFNRYFPRNNNAHFIQSDLFDNIPNFCFDLIAFNCPGWATPSTCYIHTLKSISGSQYYSMFEGDNIAIRSIYESLKYLSSHGSLIIGLNSISNIKGILNSIHSKYDNVTIHSLARAEFPLLLYNHMWQDNKDILLEQLDTWYEEGTSFFIKNQEGELYWIYEIFEIYRR